MSRVVGEAFPVDVAVTASAGTTRLSENLALGPLVVAFHRLWCPFCQQAARELMAAKDQLGEFRAQVVIVYREDVDTVRGSCAERGIAFDCLSDSDRDLERATEIKRFSVGRYAAFGPGKLVTALRAGSRIGKVSSAILQGRGTFVVGRDGRIAYAHHATNAADLAPIADVLSALRAVSGRPHSCRAGARRRSQRLPTFLPR